MTKRLYILLFILTPLINYAQVIDCDETIIPFYEKCNFKNKGAFMANYF